LPIIPVSLAALADEVESETPPAAGTSLRSFGGKFGRRGSADPTMIWQEFP
jgi:hypothetical protein